MIGRERTITVVIGALVLCATIRADMMPVSRMDFSSWPPLPVSGRSVFQPTGLSNPFGCPSIGDLDALPVGSLPTSNDDVGQTHEAQPVHTLTAEQNSLSVCLYALLGLGLCWSAPFEKKLHFACIPEWYHHGGPSQIGRSLAISPGCLCSAPVYCFLQPDGGAEDVSPQYFSRTIASLLRKSQFTRLALACRGPPYMS